MVNTKCDTCGTEIDVKPSIMKKYNHHFCSRKCNDASPHRRGKNNPKWRCLVVNCSYCGKEKTVRKYTMKYGHHFCDKICLYTWRKTLKVERFCSFCGKLKKVRPSIVEKNKHHFCNDECARKWKKENEPRGEESPYWRKQKTNCTHCGKEITLKPYRINNFRTHFCDVFCYIKYMPKGKDHPLWKGGHFPYYGLYWNKKKKSILNRANSVSELSGNNGGLLDIHHIIPIKNFLNKFIDFAFKDIPFIEISSFKVLPYELIPSLIFEEANSDENLICLTDLEHKKFEGMPPTFFAEIKRLNAEGV